MVDIQQDGTRFQGSIICPPCASICHVSPPHNCMENGATPSTRGAPPPPQGVNRLFKMGILQIWAVTRYRNDKKSLTSLHTVHSARHRPQHNQPILHVHYVIIQLKGSSSPTPPPPLSELPPLQTTSLQTTPLQTIPPPPPLLFWMKNFGDNYIIPSRNVKSEPRNKPYSSGWALAQ